MLHRRKCAQKSFHQKPEPKTVTFPQPHAVHTLPTDYSAFMSNSFSFVIQLLGEGFEIESRVHNCRNRPKSTYLVGIAYITYYSSETAGIGHNGMYSVHCVHIAWRKHNGFRFLPSF